MKTTTKHNNKSTKKLTKAEMLKKMLDDQKFIREARQKGISFKELREKYGFRFTTL